MTGTSAMPISAVICAHTDERWPELQAAVASVERQADETIVVIDHNPALCAQAGAAFGQASVIENTSVPGLSGARNSGITAARGTIIAFLDDDAVAGPTWARDMRRAYADPRVLGVGGAIIPLWETERPSWFPSEFDWVVGCTYRGMPETAKPVRNVIGCNMSFRRTVFEAIGGFLTDLGRTSSRPLGCEETELCIRVQAHYADGIILYDPAIAVYHRVTGRRATRSYFRARCYSEGLSKAQVTRTSGSRDALETERAYVRRVLPAGIARGVADALSGHDVCGGLGRAAAISYGLAVTAAGYVAGRAAEASAGWATPRAAATTAASAAGRGEGEAA